MVRVQDMQKEIYSEVESNLDQYLEKVNFEDKEWESQEGKILDDVQHKFFQAVESIYLNSLEAIEELYEDGKIDETFRDTFIEYINNRNSKHWDFSQSY